jgi:hypothetical protein
MVVIDMNLMPPNVIGKKLVYELKVLPSYQRILDPKNTQTLKGGMSQKK